MNKIATRPTWSQTLSRWMYSAVLGLLLPLIVIYLYFFSRNKGSFYRARRLERFGLVPSPKRKNGILIHCVSVGEVVTATPMIKRIQESHPELSITITTTTSTGSDRVKSLFGDSVNHFYLPFDFTLVMGAMLKRIQPSLVLVTEVELWPNMIHTCWKQNIPVNIINARLSERSAKRYAKISALFSPMLYKVSHICMQGQRDANNYENLGLAKDKSILTGNLKFDQNFVETNAEIVKSQEKRWDFSGRDVLLCGSTHSPEETFWLDVFNALQQEYPSLLLILVPRHPNRFEEVHELVQSYKLSSLKTSNNDPIQDDTQVLLVDEMGQLTALYHSADIAFVGGSIADRGGHNALEPAAYGVPTLMGRHRYNNPEICQVLEEANALFACDSVDQTVELCTLWLRDPEMRKQLGANGQHVIEANKGAISRTLEVLKL